MTWEMLRRLLDSLDGDLTVDPRELGAALQTLERRASAAPGERRVAAALRALHDCHTAEDGLDPEIGGVHRRQILAWTPWDGTWLGTHSASGGEAVVRVLRRRVDDPTTRRALARDALALRPLVPGLTAGPQWIAAPLPGDPLSDQPTTAPDRLARLAATALATLARFERAGQWPVTSPSQWRATPDGLAVIAVDSREPGDVGPGLAELAATLAPDRTPETPIEEALHAIALAPPRTAAVAVEVVERALATDLAARRHEITQRHRISARTDRVARLLEAINRMQAALPPPTGRGVVGVDLEGRTVGVEARTEGLWWGPIDAMSPVWTRRDGFDAPEARKLLRARAAAPPSERLQAEFGGTAHATEAIGSWIGSGLKMRTIRMLLERELP